MRKTRLVREALRPHPAGAVRWVVGTVAARSIPLGALAPLLPAPPGDGRVDQLALLQAAAG